MCEGGLSRCAVVCALACSIGCAGADAREPNTSHDAAVPLDAAARVPDAHATEGDPGALVFEGDRVLEIAIELASEDWDQIRHEGRSAVRVLSGCREHAFEYTEVTATVRIDGETLENVVLRKKGHLGSLSSWRPSLKLDFGELVRGRTYLGMRRLTLNNNRQDGSNTRTCMAYALFERAGVHAPRCGFARVTVNGQDLGIYSNVESIKKPFLARSFGDDSGNLYEGQGADLRGDLVGLFEKKTNEHQTDFGDLEALTQALEVEDERLLAAIEPHLNIDAFLDFWAAEVLTGHWDGYTGDLNNFYMYNNPGDGRFYFIPWGTDAAFRPHGLLPQGSVPSSVLAWARLPNRLYELEPMRARYRERLSAMLDAIWDRDALLSEVDRIGDLTSGDPMALSEQRAWIGQWAGKLESELQGAAPPWNVPPRGTPACDDRSSSIAMRFSTTWGSALSPSAGEENSFHVERNGQRERFVSVLAGAGPPRADGTGRKAFTIRGLRADGSFLQLYVFVGEPELHLGETRTHGLETVGQLYEGQNAGARPGQDARLLGFADRGVLTLERLGTRAGDPVVGRFEGMFAPLRGR